MEIMKEEPRKKNIISMICDTSIVEVPEESYNALIHIVDDLRIDGYPLSHQLQLLNGRLSNEVVCKGSYEASLALQVVRGYISTPGFEKALVESKLKEKEVHDEKRKWVYEFDWLWYGRGEDIVGLKDISYPQIEDSQPRRVETYMNSLMGMIQSRYNERQAELAEEKKVLEFQEYAQKKILERVEPKIGS